jgi:hypothetical protein
VSTRRTPAAQALIGCLALAAEGRSLNDAAKLAGYSLKAASPVWFRRGRCFHSDLSGRRVVVRRGRIVRVSGSARELTAWLLKLGRKLSVVSELSGRRAA